MNRGGRYHIAPPWEKICEQLCKMAPQKQDITPEDVLTWADNMAGVSATDTIAVAKGLQLLVEKGESDVTLGGISDADLVRIIQEGLGLKASSETEDNQSSSGTTEKAS